MSKKPQPFHNLMTNVLNVQFSSTVVSELKVWIQEADSVQWLLMWIA